jgi:hypothetical protein
LHHQRQSKREQNCQLADKTIEEAGGEEMKVYKVTQDGEWCAYAKLDDAFQHLVDELESTICDLVVGQRTPDIHIEVDEMTEEEYASLPEFDGF